VRAAVRWVLAVTALLSLGAAEVLKEPLRYRAVTLDPGQRMRFTVPGLERVTAASGTCVEEGMDTETPETFWLEASCGGLRTTLAWKKGGTRVSVMACAEDSERPAHLLKLRKKVQASLKKLKSVTACVRHGRVELWGWVETEAEKKQVAAVEKKHGPDSVRSKVELLESEE